MKKFFIKIPLQDWLDEMSPRLPYNEKLFRNGVFVGTFECMSQTSSYVIVCFALDLTQELMIEELMIEVEVYFNP